MSKNPAQIRKNSRYYQGRYECINPEKYLGDSSQIIYRSSWEKILCHKFDRSDAISAWSCEPFALNYLSPKDGLPHRYFVDFLTVAQNKTVTLIEVKPEKETQPPKKQGKKKNRYLKECLTYEINNAKWTYARAYCKEKGWNFVILTEKEILGKK